MKNLLISPPLYSYSNTFNSEMPIALMKLSTHLKSRGEEVELFDFVPYKSFHAMQNVTRQESDFKVIRNQANDGVKHDELKCYSKQEYGFNKYSFTRITGEYLTRLGFRRQRYYCGAEKSLFIDYLKKNKPDKIWVSSGVTFHYKGTVEVIDWCKEVYPDVPVELGGIYPTLCYEHAVKNTKADVVHEGISPEWCNSPMDISILPNHPQYIVRQLSKGCPNRCKFCAVSYIDGLKVSFVDIDKDIQEIKEARDKYGITRIKLWGSNTLMPGNGKLFEEWLDKLIALDGDFQIVCPEGFAPERLTLNLCKKIKKAGFNYIEIPLEDASEEYLTESMKKNYNIEEWSRAVDYALEAGFCPGDIYVAIIIGTPMQGEENLEEAIRILHSKGVRPIARPYTPVPKSEWYETDELFPNLDLEVLHGYVFPAINNVEDYRKISRFSNLLTGDYIGDYKDVIESYVGEKERIKQRDKESEMAQDLLSKMATILLDIADQQKELISLIKEQNGKKDEKETK